MRKVESEITKDISLSRQEDGKYQDDENIHLFSKSILIKCKSVTYIPLFDLIKILA